MFFLYLIHLSWMNLSTTLTHFLSRHRYVFLWFRSLSFLSSKKYFTYIIRVEFLSANSRFSSTIPVPYILMSFMVETYTSLKSLSQTLVSSPEPDDWHNSIWRKLKIRANKNLSQQADSLLCMYCNYVLSCNAVCIAIVYGSCLFSKPSKHSCSRITLEIKTVVLPVSSSIDISCLWRSNFCVEGFASNKYFWIVLALILFDCNVFL